MIGGYKVFWTDYALDELAQTISYLETNWTEKELRKFSNSLEETINFIRQNPYFFQQTDLEKDVRRAVVQIHNTLYYRIIRDTIEVISLFSNLQNPEKRKLK